MENKHQIFLKKQEEVKQLITNLEHTPVNSDLYLMPSFPDRNLERYKGAYILVNKTLKYVNFFGKYEDVKLNDVALFFQNIGLSKGVNKLHLSNEQVKYLITENGGHKPSINKGQNIQQLKQLLSNNPELSNLTIEFEEPANTSQQVKENRHVVRGLFHVLSRLLFNPNKKTPLHRDQTNQIYELLQWMLDLPEFQIEQLSSDMDNCLHFLTHYGAYDLLITAVNSAFHKEKLHRMTTQQNTFSETPLRVAEKRYKQLLENKQLPEAEKAKRAWYLLILANQYSSTLFAGKLAITWNDVTTHEGFLGRILSQKKPHSEVVTKIENAEIKVAKKSNSNDADLVIQITVPKAHLSSLEKFEAAWKKIFGERLYAVELSIKNDLASSHVIITANKQVFFLHSLLQLLAIADLIYQHFGLDICTAIQNGFYTYEVKLMQVDGDTLPPFEHGNPTLIKFNDVTNDKISYYIYGRHEESGSFQLTQLDNLPALMELNFLPDDTDKIQISPQKNAQIYQEIKKQKGYQPFLSPLYVSGYRPSEKLLEMKISDKEDSGFIKDQQFLYVKAHNIESLEKIASLLNGENFYPWFIESDNLFLFITYDSPKKFQALQILVGKAIDSLEKDKFLDKPLDKSLEEVNLLNENIQILFEDFISLCDYIKQSPQETEQLKNTYLQWEEYFFNYINQAKQLGIIDNHFLKSCERNTVTAQAGRQDNRSTTIKEKIYQMIQMVNTNKQLQEFRKTFGCFPQPKDFRVNISTPARTPRLLNFGPMVNAVSSGTIQFCYLPNEAEQIFPQFQELLKEINPNIVIKMFEENNFKIISISGEPLDQIKKNDIDGQISFRILANSKKDCNFDVLIAKIHRLLGMLWNWDESVSFQKIEDNQNKTYFVITVKPTQQPLEDNLIIQQRPSFCLVM